MEEKQALMEKKQTSVEEMQTLPPQHQDRQPGVETAMQPRPRSDERQYVGSGKLKGQVAIITGGEWNWQGGGDCVRQRRRRHPHRLPERA
jgi:hypothetical protein